MNPARVEIVLVRPSRPANVASACRAMKNMGLGPLRLVEPPPGLEHPDARALAYGAWDVLDGAIVAPSLESAVAGSTLVVGTSGRPAARSWTPRRLALEGGARAGGGSTAIVFGPEATGLREDELDLCHVRVHIPTSPAHSSLNLAQAVLILGYEIFLGTATPAASVAQDAPVSAGEIETALESLREGLLGIGFLNKENPGAILAELRRLIARAGPSPREVVLIRGMGRQIAWAAREIARGAGGKA